MPDAAKPATEVIGSAVNLMAATDADQRFGRMLGISPVVRAAHSGLLVAVDVTLAILDETAHRKM